MLAREENARWWPPKVNDRLRHLTVNEDGRLEALCHVVSVFEHAGDGVRAVVAEWWKFKQRWHYDVISDVQAIVGSYWPDGHARPK